MLTHREDYRDVQPVLATGCGIEVDDTFVERFGRDDFERFMELGGVVGTHGEILPFLSESGRSALLGQHRALGTADAVGLVVRPEPGVWMALFAVTSEPVRLRARQRMRLVQLALHLQNALRLRRTPNAVHTVVAPDGTIVDLHGSPSTPAHGIWNALVAGNCSVVPREWEGVACYGVLENEPTARCFRALSAAEKRVVQHASRGLSNKMLGYALGLSPSSISRLLESAALKLGFGSRAKLVRIASLLSGDETATPTTELTQAEGDVLELVRAGLSNRAIAEARGRSERTVANQVAALLRKTGSQNRRRLIAASFYSTKYPTVSPPKNEVAST